MTFAHCYKLPRDSRENGVCLDRIFQPLVIFHMFTSHCLRIYLTVV